MPKGGTSSSHETTDDVIRDERANRLNGPVDESVIRGHRADMWVGTGIHMPSGTAAYANGPKRSATRHRQHRSHKRHKRGPAEVYIDEEMDKKMKMAPGQRVQFLLNQDDELQGDLETRRIFTEMVELNGTDGQQEWRETARWVKFEEDVEEGGNRWSKPHVATLSLHSLFELRSCLLSGTVILDLEATELVQVVDILLDKLIASKSVEEDHRELIRESLLRKHIHQYEHTRSGAKDAAGGAHGGGSSFLNTVRSIADIGRQFSHAKNLQQQESGGDVEAGHQKVSKQQSSGFPSSGPQLQLPKVASVPKEMTRDSSTADTSKGNQHFFKKLPPGAEASNVLIGQVEFLDHHVSAFIRLKNACLLGDLTEVPVPTRFLFILLGPQGHGTQYREIGRAIATLMSDEIFHDVAYKAHSRNDLLDGVDEFLDQVTVLPPGEWDPNIRIEPPSSIPSQEKRKGPQKPVCDKDEEVEEEEGGGGHGADPALKRTGRLFGGLIADIKRKLPFYVSDYTDAFNLQCLAAFMFMYFAMLAPIVTFGGLLEEATDKRMAAIENLLSGAVCGTIYSLFSGQPLTMIGSTGPVLIFEKIIFEMTEGKWDYLALRWWINIWSALILLIIVATDASALVSYITRFTEENFSVLISFIFVYEALNKMTKILNMAHVIPFHKDLPPHPYCGCQPKNYNSSYGDEYWDAYNLNHSNQYSTLIEKSNRAKWKGQLDTWLMKDDITNITSINWSNVPLTYCKDAFGQLDNPHDQCYRMYDVFLMSIVLTLGTFTLAFTLKMMKTSSYFPNKIRDVLSDFAVIIALISMVLLDYYVGLDTPKLFVPDRIEPTLSTHRGWVVDPFHGNPWWSAIVAIAPAILLCILLFMDHDITIVIVNRKENKLKKGCGYHLDLFVLSFGIVISGMLGLPIFVAATVMSISHVNALRVESECRAPGEKPTFVGVREQRVTGLMVFIFIGLSVVMTKVLKLIPMPVLYGVFLYMGVSSLRGVQMIDRLLLFIIPMKYQPDYVYLRHVPIKRVHLFTIFQLGCFVVLCVIKEIEITSIVFPIMLVVMVGVRKLMEYVFTDRELKYLDDPMPEITIRKKEDAKKKKEQLLKEQAEDEADQFAKLGTVKTEANLHIQLASGNVMKIPLSSIGEKGSENATSSPGSIQPPPGSAGGHSQGSASGGAVITTGSGTTPQQSMNISEEFNKSGLWQHIASETSLGSKDKSDTHKKMINGGSGKKNREHGGHHHHHQHKVSGGEKLTTPEFADADDDNDPITIKIERASPDPRISEPANETQPLLDRSSDSSSPFATKHANNNKTVVVDDDHSKKQESSV